MPGPLLFDAYNRQIRKTRLFGYGQTPASEPDSTHIDIGRAGAPADAIGFEVPAPEDPPDEVTGDPHEDDV